ncbi:MAG: tetratricopeptide repeat protein [Burkholderiales bacterium]
MRRTLACLVLALAATAPAGAGDLEAGVAAARRGDYGAALREWRPLAEAGNPHAQFNLGLLYENGLGVPADGAEAARWYRRAAEQNDRQAQAYLAEMYAQGLGVARDDVQALHWYRLAAQRGDAASQYNVGLFYAAGRGIAPSDVQAVAWLSVAHENGAPPTELLETLWKHMPAASLTQAERLAEDVRRQCRVN